MAGALGFRLDIFSGTSENCQNYVQKVILKLHAMGLGTMILISFLGAVLHAASPCFGVCASALFSSTIRSACLELEN